MELVFHLFFSVVDSLETDLAVGYRSHYQEQKHESKQLENPYETAELVQVGKYLLLRNEYVDSPAGPVYRAEQYHVLLAFVCDQHISAFSVEHCGVELLEVIGVFDG